MWCRVARWCRRVADYLDPPAATVRPARSPYWTAASALVADAETRLGSGFGDAKRRDVYASLMKQFPTARRRDLAFVIEQVLQNHD